MNWTILLRLLFSLPGEISVSTCFNLFEQCKPWSYSQYLYLLILNQDAAFPDPETRPGIVLIVKSLYWASSGHPFVPPVPAEHPGSVAS